MGNSIDYSKNKVLLLQDGESCEEGLRINRKFVQALTDNLLRTVKDFSKTTDYQTYHLYPGQQIRRSHIIFPHTAIYLYDGIIVEMGSGPAKCKRFPVYIHNVVGLHTLKEFKRYAKGRGETVCKVVTPKDGSRTEIERRLKRVQRLVGPHRYDAVTANCIQTANYVTFGQQTMFVPDIVTVPI